MSVSLFGDLGNLNDLDATVRLRLASSLAHIFDRVEGHLAIDRDRCQAALQTIRKQRQDPGVFARYYDLILAINDDRLDAAERLIADLVERTTATASFAIVPYCKEELGADYDRFPRLLFSEYSTVNPMETPSDAQSSASTQALLEAMQIISRVDRSIRAEIDALLVRIYLTGASKHPDARRFGGVTSFMIWGGSFMNLEFYRTRWDAVQFLVHEITHGLLFGLSFDEPLILNPPSEGYPSPLRADPRPMDGLFHAALVCARLASFNQAWLESGLAQGTDREKSQQAAESNTGKFRDGLSAINQYGKLSPQARGLVDRCCQGLGVLA
jgi:hypothetical protein